MKPARRIAAALAITICTVAFAACGGSKSKSTSSQAAPASTTASTLATGLAPVTVLAGINTTGPPRPIPVIPLVSTLFGLALLLGAGLGARRLLRP